MRENSKQKIHKMILLVSILILGTLALSLTMIKSGLVYSFGAGFWGANGHDGIWHIALIESLSRGSWNLPVFAGAELQNYHIGFDLIVSIIHKLSFISVPVLYFQFLPPIFALLIGLSCYKFIRRWRNSFSASFWALFFVYFGGSFGWIVTIFKNRNFDGESLFWSQQSISTLINPPFALSLIFLFTGLYFLLVGVESRDIKRLTLATFLFGILVQIKIYAGLLALSGLFAAGTWEFIKHRNLSVIKVFVGSLIISILLFFNYDSSKSGIIFSPFWFLENMMALSDRVGWDRFYSAMVNYKSGHVYIKAFMAYSVAFALFIIGNFGTRIVSFRYFVSNLIKPKKMTFMDVFLITVVLAGIVVTTFFVQSGSPWNTIQFFYYSLIFSGVLASISIADSFEFSIKKPIRIRGFFDLVLSFVIILLTIPTSFASLAHHYLPTTPPAKLSHDELKALKFLSEQPGGIILTYPFSKELAGIAQKNPPRPLYLYESTAYVSAYGKHDVFLEDEVNLDITGYDWKTRREQVEKFYLSLDHKFVQEFLKSNDIKYVYWLKGQRATLGEEQLGIVRIFENETVDIYRVL